MFVAADRLSSAADVRTAGDSRVALKLIGASLAALIPALFWTALMAGVGSLTGVAFSASALAMTGGAIAVFLGAVCVPLMLRD